MIVCTLSPLPPVAIFYKTIVQYHNQHIGIGTTYRSYLDSLKFLCTNLFYSILSLGQVLILTTRVSIHNISITISTASLQPLNPAPNSS